MGTLKVDGLTGTRSLHVDERDKPRPSIRRVDPVNIPCPLCGVIAEDGDYKHKVFWRHGPWWCLENKWNPIEGYGRGELLIYERHIDSLEACSAQELGDLVEALWLEQGGAGEAKILRFTNVGVAAGASQSHLHTQRVRVDLEGGRGPLGEAAWRADLLRAQEDGLAAARGEDWEAYVAPAPQFFGEVRVVAADARGLGAGVKETLDVVDDKPVAYNVLWHRFGDLWGAQIVVAQPLSLYRELADVVPVRVPVESWARDIRGRRGDESGA